jgi:hypothetical protein
MSSGTPIPEPKDQHFIPRFYLKGFTDNHKLLYVYERFKPLRESKPKKEANRPDYYTLAGENGRDETAEGVFANIESAVAPTIRKLANPSYVLTPEKAANLIVFVAFMFVRVPTWREYLHATAIKIARNIHIRTASDREKFDASCDAMEQSTGRPLGMDREKLRQSVLRQDYDLVPSEGFSLGAMLKSGLTVLNELKTFGYQGLYAPDGRFFMTSDSPVFTICPDGNGEATVGMGFAWPNVEVYFPLNKRICLRLKRGIQPKGIPIAEDRLEEINNLVMATAGQYLYSCERYRRISRLFTERGCKVRAGRDAFMTEPPPPGGHKYLLKKGKRRRK